MPGQKLVVLIVAGAALAGCGISKSDGGIATSIPPSTATSTSVTIPPSSPTSASGSTTTNPEARSSYYLAFVGDTGTGGDQQYEVADLIETADDMNDFAFLVLLGDMIYETGDPALIDTVILDPYSGTLDGTTELVPMLGNHDVEMEAGDEIMATLGAPQRWYSVGDERLLLVVLDSTRPNDTDQLEFLTDILSGANSDWIVVALHHAPFSAGFHGSDSVVQDVFVPIFEDHGVDIVFAGHDHDYQRSHLINGITYVVTGAGAKLRPTDKLSFTAVSASVPHFVSLEVRPGSMVIEAISTEGVIDRFELVD